MPDSNPQLWIAIPAFNEASRLGQVLSAVCELYRNVVVVDDGSTDGTADCAGTFPVQVLRHERNLGQGAALRTAIEFALDEGAAFLVTFDADGQHSAAEISTLVGPLLLNTADVVLGSRFLGTTIGMPRLRRALLRAAVFATRWQTGLDVTDTHNGFRSMNRKAAERIQITQPRMAHATQILTEIRRHHLRYVEVPVTVTYSPETLAKGQTFWGVWQILWQLFTVAARQ